MTTPPDLTDLELAVTSKALDVHRQALVRKLGRIGETDHAEQHRTLEEIKACSSAGSKFRTEADRVLSARAS